MKDNTRIAIGYVCFAAVLITFFIAIFTATTLRDFPAEHTININITSDNNTLQIIETMERIQKLELKHSNNELNTTNNSLN